MKKTLIAFAVAAAFASAASAASFKAGTYTATAPGIHGDVTVEVTFYRRQARRHQGHDAVRDRGHRLQGR